MSELDDTSLGHEAGPELPAHLRAALLAGDLDGGPSDLARARMAKKLAAATGVAVAALLPSGGAGLGAGAGVGAGAKLIALGVAAALIGGGIGYAISERPTRREALVETPSPWPSASPSPDARIDLPPTPSPDDARIEIDIRAIAGVDAGIRSPAPAPRNADDLAGERVLLDAARAALRADDPRLAMKNLIEHELRYPDGALVEERRVLRIEVAVRQRDPGQARALARRFLADYPRSVFRARVEELVTEAP